MAGAQIYRELRAESAWRDARLELLRAIREIVPNGNGDFVLTLQSGKQVESGRSYRHRVVELLRGWGNSAPATAV